MNQKHTSDWMLVLSVLTGLYSSVALAGILLAVLVRGEFVRLRLRIHHVALGAAACWALYVVSLRGMASLHGQLPYLTFLWTLPFLMACYRPDADTVHAFRRMLLALFAVDLFFNLYSLVFGADLLGRAVDLRAAVTMGRDPCRTRGESRRAHPAGAVRGGGCSRTRGRPGGGARCGGATPGHR